MNKACTIDKIAMSLDNVSTYIDKVTNNLHILNSNSTTIQWIVGSLISANYSELVNKINTDLIAGVGVLDDAISDNDMIRIYKVTSTHIFFMIKGDTHIGLFKMSNLGVIELLFRLPYVTGIRGAFSWLEIDDNFVLVTSEGSRNFILDKSLNTLTDVSSEGLTDIIKYKDKYYSIKPTITLTLLNTIYEFNMLTKTSSLTPLAVTPSLGSNTSYTLNYLKNNKLYMLNGVSGNTGQICNINMDTFAASVVKDNFDLAIAQDVENSVGRYYNSGVYDVVMGNMTYFSDLVPPLVIDNVVDDRISLIELIDPYYASTLDGYYLIGLTRILNTIIAVIPVRTSVGLYTSFILVTNIESNASIKTTANTSSIFQNILANKNMLILAAIGVGAFVLMKKKSKPIESKEDEDDFEFNEL